MKSARPCANPCRDAWTTQGCSEEFWTFTYTRCNDDLLAQLWMYYDDAAAELQADLRQTLAPVNETIHYLKLIRDSKRVLARCGGGRAGAGRRQEAGPRMRSTAWLSVPGTAAHNAGSA